MDRPLGFLPSSAGLAACAAVLLVQAAVLADVIIDASVESGEPASLATVSRQAFGPVRSSYHTPTLGVRCTPRFRV